MRKREIQPKWKVVAKGRVLRVLSLEHDVICDLISVMKEESKKGQVGRLVTRNKKKQFWSLDYANGMENSWRSNSFQILEIFLVKMRKI
jgi:hypothetical protein